MFVFFDSLFALSTIDANISSSKSIFPHPVHTQFCHMPIPPMNGVGGRLLFPPPPTLTPPPSSLFATLLWEKLLALLKDGEGFEPSLSASPSHFIGGGDGVDACGRIGVDVPLLTLALLMLLTACGLVLST